MHRIEDRLTQVQARINEAAQRSARNAEEITLLGVSKKQPMERLEQAYAAGLRDFGENYLQEALEKQAVFQAKNIANDIRWHFIGPIQSNKTRHIAEHFSWVHSVDRLKIAQRLNEQRPESLPPLNVCLQVNIDNEASKAGITIEELVDCALAISAFERLNLRGLMIIPRPRTEEENPREAFARCRELIAKLNDRLTSELDTLSMGMSADLDSAIAEGATIVRIGTALFGERA